MQLLINSLKGARLVETEDIIYCEADEKYTNIYLKSLINIDKEYFVATKLLKEIELLLPEICFFRCHKNCLINFKYFLEFDVSLNSIILTNEKKIQISRRKKAVSKENLLKYIENYNSKKANLPFIPKNDR